MAAAANSTTSGKRKINPTAILSMLLLVVVIGIYLPIVHLHSKSLTSAESSYESGLRRLDASRSRIRRRDLLQHGGGGPSSSSAGYVRDLEDRLEYLETKLDSYLAYNSDPYLRLKNPATCHQKRMIKDLACTDPDPAKCAVDNQSVCLDNFPDTAVGIFSSSSGGGGGLFQTKKRNNNGNNGRCIVYDFGIRESPEYGLAFVNSPFNCEVVGFDPSPISVKWWSKNKDKLSKLEKDHDDRNRNGGNGDGDGGGGGTYNFMAVGAGGVDGTLTLREYDWDQVSILEFPLRVVNTNDCNSKGMCRYNFHKKQGTHQIPVTTLQTVMKQLHHDRITLLKLDVEGSEYMFLEKMIDDLSCRNVDQLTLEWHHYDYDTRYGVTSNPQINMLGTF